MGAGGYVFPVFLTPVVDDLGWSRTAYAAAMPVMSTTVALAGPLVGWLTERRGPRVVLVAGALLMSGALATAGLMRTPAEFYAIALAVGIAVACLGDLPTGAAIAARFAARRGLALGAVYVGSNLGGALVPLAGLALAAGSWRHAFLGIGAVLALLLVPAALAVGPAPPRPADRAAAPARAGWRAVLRQRDFWLLFWVLFVFYLYRIGLNAHLVAFLGDLGYSQLAAAGGFSLTLALGIGGKLLAGAIADRLGARPAVIGNFALIAIASGLLLVPHIPGALPAFIGLHGFATAAEDVVIPLIIAQRFGDALLARVYGLLLLALVPGGALGPLIAGRVFDTTGSYQPVFAAFAILNVTAVAALATLSRSAASARR